MKKIAAINFLLCISVHFLYAQNADKKPEQQSNLLTRYQCIKGDLTSPVPGECPKHHIKLLSDFDTNLAGMIKEEVQKNKEWGKDRKRAEDNLYVCIKGDYIDFMPGKCTVHNLELLDKEKTEVAELVKKEIEKNPDWGKKAMKRIDNLYYCIYSDYKAREQGKCPVHENELLLMSDPNYAAKVSGIKKNK